MSQFVIDDDDDDDEVTEDDKNRLTEKPVQLAAEDPGLDEEELPPLAERLIAALVDLAFVPGFTVAEECRTDDMTAIAYVIW
jgi:hypothetical protein